jgi:hypothetical protein
MPDGETEIEAPGRWWTGCTMSGETDAVSIGSEQVPAPAAPAMPAVRRESAIA